MRSDVDDYREDERRIECPYCASTDYRFVYMDTLDQIVGCSNCVHAVDADLFQEQEEAKAYDAMVDKEINEKLAEKVYKEKTCKNEN